MKEYPFILFTGAYFEYEHLNLNEIIEKVNQNENPSLDKWFRLYKFCEKKIALFNEICGI
jgi:hypothetical protein